MNQHSPIARQDSLIVKELAGETLVYDRQSDEAFCLNPTAATIWKSCDGRTSVSEIAQRLSADTETKVPEDVVWLALDQLEKFKLLDQPVQKPISLTGMSRRHVVRTLGLAAVALPMISSIIVPTPSQAQSFGPCCEDKDDCEAFPGTSCNNSEHAPCGKTCSNGPEE